LLASPSPSAEIANCDAETLAPSALMVPGFLLSLASASMQTPVLPLRIEASTAYNVGQRLKVNGLHQKLGNNLAVHRPESNSQKGKRAGGRQLSGFSYQKRQQG